MDKEKQIEEMAKDFCALDMPCEECHLYKNRCHAKKYATRAYNAGYRKASKVAREIFEELSKFIVTKVIDNGTITYDIGDKYKELQKKYGVEGINPSEKLKRSRNELRRALKKKYTEEK